MVETIGISKSCRFFAFCTTHLLTRSFHRRCDRVQPRRKLLLPELAHVALLVQAVQRRLLPASMLPELLLRTRQPLRQLLRLREQSSQENSRN